MKTKEELINWIYLRDRELINLGYDLIDSLNEPEIDRNVRRLQKCVANFSESLQTVKDYLESELKVESNKSSL